jgi:hypothetical protein
MNGRIINGVPVRAFGDELDWVVAIGHHDPQDMAETARSFVFGLLGEDVEVQAGTVRLCWGIWDDGDLNWEGVDSDQQGAFAVTVAGVGDVQA